MQLRNKQAQQVFKFKLKRKLLLVMSLLTLWTPLSLVQAQMTIDKNESAMQSVGQSSGGINSPRARHWRYSLA